MRQDRIHRRDRDRRFWRDRVGTSGVKLLQCVGGVAGKQDVAPLVVYLLSDQARHITGQIYTAVGNKIAVWNQPREVRAMYADGRWTADQIGQRLDSTIGQERMGILDALDAMRAAAAAGAKPNA